MIKDLLQDARERMDEVDRGRRSTSSRPCAPGARRRTSWTASRSTTTAPSTPLKQLANVAATEARLLTITPYDKSAIKQIEKAILESDLGLTPYNDGNLVRLAIPELTEERRKELVKVVHGLAEEGRVAVRNIRRDCMHDLRELGRRARSARTRSAAPRPSCRS